MNPFTEDYQSMPTDQLLKRVARPKSYLPEAVEAARAELERRGLSGDEIQAAAESKKSRKFQLFRQPDKGAVILDQLDPAIGEPALPQRIFWILSVVLVLLALLDMSKGARILIAYSRGIYDLTPPYLTMLGTEALFAIAVLLFCWRKKIGWYLVAIIYAFELTIKLQLWKYFLSPVGSTSNPDLTPTTLDMMITTGIPLALLVALCIPNIRSIFKISSGSMWFTLLLGAILSFGFGLFLR